ncbi:unnamed protein product [Leptidea sinapis]|uniref:Uncharacterized protein n=1 Tax=Leptidea sinapis TaxID=189913 RepID=A0A5E4QY02_9NEOP|nr:unnamed protein product [Leptidea sinapis]
MMFLGKPNKFSYGTVTIPNYLGIMPRNYSRKTDRQRWDTTSMEKAFQAINNNEARRRFNGS